MDDSRPSAPTRTRNRVAVPLEMPPKPSLIPVDVLDDVAREDRLAGEVSFESMDPSTSPLPVPEAEIQPDLSEITADVEVGLVALSQVPLFQSLARPTLYGMIEGAKQVEIPNGEFLFREGAAASSFFVVIDGTIEILRKKDDREVRLRHLNRNEAIGLFGLFTTQVRAASARAIGDTVVLEISGEKVQKVLDRDAALHDKLLQFFHERLLEGFMANKIFSDIDSIARARLIGRFQNRPLEKDETLLNPGEVANLIAVVTHGTLIVEERTKMGGPPKQSEVGMGQFIVVSCAMSGLPSKQRIYAPEFATVSILQHKDFNDLIRDYPALRSLPARMSGAAKQIDRDVFAGATGVPGL